MEEHGPIIFIDDDEEDHLIFLPILQQLAPQSPVRFFTDVQQALDYLRSTPDRVFLIISEVALHPMNGLEMRAQIEQDEALKRKAIPFIFFSSPVYKQQVEEAYQYTIQGFFEKQNNVEAMHQQLQAIVAYWAACLHPNRFKD
jgi:CheY-like chemotaxis protein